MFHSPFSPNTASVAVTRPRVSSAAAVNSLAVEPGSNGSVNVGRARRPAAGRLPRCEREQFARLRIEEHDVAALGPHLGDGVVQPALGDLLQLGVDRERDVVAGDRIARLPAGRVVAPARAVLEQHGLARAAGEQRVERALEARGADGPLGRETADDRAGEVARGIEALELARRGGPRSPAGAPGPAWR